MIATLLASRSVSAALIAFAAVAAPAVDVLLLGSGHLISSLYGIPVLIAAPLWTPRAVTALAAAMVGLHGLVSVVQQHEPELWLLYTVSLLMISGLAVMVSAQQQQIQGRMREADAARKQLQTFMSMVAHELSGPVTGVLGQAQFALRTARGQRERRVLRSIESEARQLARLIEDLRDAARLGTGGFELTTERLNLSGLVEAAVERWQETSRDRTVRLTVASPSLSVDGDRQRLTQVLDNLLSNALKYSPRETQVEVSVRPEAGGVVISVDDQGAGIPTEARAALFQPFSRLPGSEGVAGTGLGLYITHAIVVAHNGSIEVVDRAGGGSSFIVRLPASADAVRDAAEAVAG